MEVTEREKFDLEKQKFEFEREKFRHEVEQKKTETITKFFDVVKYLSDQKFDCVQEIQEEYPKTIFSSMGRSLDETEEDILEFSLKYVKQVMKGMK